MKDALMYGIMALMLLGFYACDQWVGDHPPVNESNGWNIPRFEQDIQDDGTVEWIEVCPHCGRPFEGDQR